MPCCHGSCSETADDRHPPQPRPGRLRRDEFRRPDPGSLPARRVRPARQAALGHCRALAGQSSRSCASRWDRRPRSCRSWSPMRRTRLRSRQLCAGTRVVASTVGPYALYGEPLVKVCARDRHRLLRPDRRAAVDPPDDHEVRSRCAQVGRPHRPQLRIRLDPVRPWRAFPPARVRPAFRRSPVPASRCGSRR